MYKVCFADDEIMNHQLLEKLVDWKKYGFEIAGKATDGVEALQLYEEQRPDLFLIDIKMPCMDGLECAKHIREADDKVKIVMVSAYSEFTYAQKAIQYGVQDFIVKPISRIVLNSLVEKIKQMLDKEKNSEKTQNNSAEFLLKMRYMILEGKTEELLNEDKYENFFSSIGQIGYLRIFDREGRTLNRTISQRIASEFHEIMEKKSGEGVVISENEGKILIVTGNNVTLQELVHDWKNPSRYLLDVYKLTKWNCRRQICEFFQQAYMEENPGFYRTTGGFYEGTIKESFKTEPKIDYSAILNYVELDKGKIRLNNYFEDLFFKCKKEQIDPAILKSSILDGLVVLKLKLKEYFGEDAFYMLRDIKVKELTDIEKAVYLKTYVTIIIDKLTIWMKKVRKEDSRETQILKKANEYAKANFMRIDFAVQEAADFVGLSRNYFVTVYKEYANRGFWEYITELRIEKAKELLLAKDWTVSYIARYVGYESEYHFSRRFKEIVGLSPLKYRKSEQKANKTE